MGEKIKLVLRSFQSPPPLHLAFTCDFVFDSHVKKSGASTFFSLFFPLMIWLQYVNLGICRVLY